MSTAIYTAPSDGKVFGTMEVDITAAERYIQEQREKGSHITITHVVVAAIARAVALDAPEINGFVRRGNVIPRDYVDVSVAVNIKTDKNGKLLSDEEGRPMWKKKIMKGTLEYDF